MPTLRDVSQDPVLSNVATFYKNEDYVAGQILPTLPVKKQHGVYYIYDKAKFRKEYTKRAAGAPAKTVESFGLSTGTFFCEDHALKGFVPNEVQDQADNPISAQSDETEGLTEMLLVDKEKELADYMANTANITQNTTLAGTDQWSDYENSSPIDDVKTALSTVHAAILRKPNTLILGQQVYDKLVDHPDIVDRIKYSQLGVATPELLARLFNVAKVIIAGAGYNTATEGQTDAISYIWGKHAWLLYIAPTTKIKQITFGLNLSYEKRKTEKWTDGDRKGTFVRVHENYDQKIVASAAAYLIKDAIA